MKTRMLAIAALVTVFSSTAAGWGAQGHRLVALLASHRLTPRALAPRVGGQRRDPGDTKPEARGDRRDVGFGAADLDVELPNGLEARGRRQ